MRIIINLMISYCQCRRQAIPPLEGQCRRGGEQDRLENHYRELLRFLVPGWGWSMQQRCRPRRVFARWSAPVERRSSVRRLFCTGRRSTWRWTSTVVAGCAGRNPWRSWTTRRAWPVPRRRRWSTRGSAWTTCSARWPSCRPSAAVPCLLRKLDGLSHSQIAEHLECPQPGGKAHRQRDEALSGAHARMGSRLISLFVLGNA